MFGGLIMLNRAYTFKDKIQNSVRDAAVYDYALGSNYNTGFKRHKGMVHRTIDSTFKEWFENQMWRYRGKTCIINFIGELGTLPYESDLYDMTVLRDVMSQIVSHESLRETEKDICIYTPNIEVVNSHNISLGNVDVISLCVSSNVSKMFNRVLLAIHMTACLNMDNVIIGDCGVGMGDGYVKGIAKMISDTGSLYECYISNIFYLISDKRNNAVYREVIGSK